MADRAAAWIRFLRLYGPGACNDNQYDEKIRTSARRSGFRPLEFEHPVEPEVLRHFGGEAPTPTSVVLTGTAGDGKSHLCRKVWRCLGGGDAEWDSNDPYFCTSTTIAGQEVTVHILRDLTGLPAVDDRGRYESKQHLLEMFCEALFAPIPSDIFLVAANDGQLIDPWRRLPQTPTVVAAQRAFESLLVEDRRSVEGVRLQFFNLSRIPSRRLFDLALADFLGHEGWQTCWAQDREDKDFFGERCPIRHNYELLAEPRVQQRLRALFELCDHNDLHIPIRRILQLLVNAVLGHADAKDGLMRAGDVRDILQRRTVARASLFNNVFGGNLTETRRQSLEVFECLNRFRIGHETSNRVDNLLIFGETDEHLRPYFDALLRADTFYGADESYYAAQRAYVEGAEAGDGTTDRLLDLMVSQRRGLFFKIPVEQVDELALWDLTVFRFAGEYLSRVVAALRAGQRVDRAILARLVRGLNRIFVGMLVNTERELLLATSASFSSARVSQILVDRISVARRNRESLEIVVANDRPTLVVNLNDTLRCELPLNLTRFEFLSRVAEGVLPGSFSRECYEDILAFKSRLLTAATRRRELEGADEGAVVTLTLLHLDAAGNPTDETVEFAHD